MSVVELTKITMQLQELPKKSIFSQVYHLGKLLYYLQRKSMELFGYVSIIDN